MLITNDSSPTTKLLIRPGGNVLIGTFTSDTPHPDAKLQVRVEGWEKSFSIVNTDNDKEEFRISGDGRVFARKITVTEKNFPDYVFNKDYKLMSLQELEAYIETNNKLPNMPSAEEVKENGADMGEIQRVSVEKIEELTLYIIELKKEIEQLKQQVNEK